MSSTASLTSANNPDLATLVHNLRADQTVNQEEKETLFKEIEESNSLPIWDSLPLEKIETPLGAFTSTKSLRESAQSLLRHKTGDDQSVLLEIRDLMLSESYRIARFISLLAESENKLGLQDHKIEYGFGEDRPATHVYFETSDGYKFGSKFAMTSLDWMANRNLRNGLNVASFTDSSGHRPVSKEVVHAYGDKLPPQSGLSIKTDGSEEGDCFPDLGYEDLDTESDVAVSHLDLLTNPERVSLKRVYD